MTYICLHVRTVVDLNPRAAKSPGTATNIHNPPVIRRFKFRIYGNTLLPVVFSNDIGHLQKERMLIFSPLERKLFNWNAINNINLWNASSLLFSISFRGETVSANNPPGLTKRSSCHANQSESLVYTEESM